MSPPYAYSLFTTFLFFSFFFYFHFCSTSPFRSYQVFFLTIVFLQIELGGSEEWGHQSEILTCDWLQYISSRKTKFNAQCTILTVSYSWFWPLWSLSVREVGGEAWGRGKSMYTWLGKWMHGWNEKKVCREKERRRRRGRMNGTEEREREKKKWSRSDRGGGVKSRNSDEGKLGNESWRGSSERIRGDEAVEKANRDVREREIWWESWEEADD